MLVDLWDHPGTCELLIEGRGGDTHFFEVAPRIESFAAGLPGGLIAPVSPAAWAAQGAMMFGGMTVESAAKQCGGAFSIIPVLQVDAIPKLVDLRESDW